MMKKGLRILLLAVLSLCVSCSDEKETTEATAFEPVKLVFKEKSEELLLFKEMKQVTPTEEQKEFFFEQSNIKERDANAAKDYFLFESEKNLKIEINNEVRVFEYKFEDGFLKLFHEGAFRIYALGENTNEIQRITIADVDAQFYQGGESYESISAGSTGEIKEYMNLPLSFDNYKPYHFKELKDIAGNKEFYLYKAIYTFRP